MRSVFFNNTAHRKVIRAGLLGVSAIACVAALSINSPSAAQMTEFNRTQTAESSVGRDPYQFTLHASTSPFSSCTEIPVPEGKTLTITGITGQVTSMAEHKPTVSLVFDGGGGEGWGFSKSWAHLPIELAQQKDVNWAVYSLTANPMIILGKPGNAPAPYTASICVSDGDPDPFSDGQAYLAGWVSGYLEDDHDFFSGTMMLD